MNQEPLPAQGPVDVNVSPLPCPFCGSDDVHHVIDRADDEYEYVLCNGCGAGASRADTCPERRPLEVWNMRANVI